MIEGVSWGIGKDVGATGWTEAANTAASGDAEGVTGPEIVRATVDVVEEGLLGETFVVAVVAWEEAMEEVAVLAVLGRDEEGARDPVVAA